MQSPTEPTASRSPPLAGGNTIGGATTAFANEISGNTGYGIDSESSSSDNYVANDYLGTGPGGSGSLPNGSAGLFIGGTVTAGGQLVGNVVNDGTLGFGFSNSASIDGD